MRVLPTIVTSSILTLALAAPCVRAYTYNLAGDWGTKPSVWSYGTGWAKETGDSPSNWAAGDVTVSLGAWPDASMVTWMSPTDGTFSISGDAWNASNFAADSVYLQLIPESLAGSLTLQNFTQGTTSLANGTVQAGYSSIDNKSGFGSTSIPLRDVSSLADLPVEAGDVVALVVSNTYLYAGQTVGADLTIDMLLLGDTNDDGIVDAADLAALNANFGQKGIGGYAAGDFNNDGVVNGDDYALFDLGLAEYNHSVGNPLPEPACLTLLALGAAGLTGRRS